MPKLIYRVVSAYGKLGVSFPRDVLRSTTKQGVETKDGIAQVLHLSAEEVAGTYFVDACNAIKISIDRSNLSASPDERDVFGAQQQAWLERLRVPRSEEDRPR